ncbi:MAG: hypothetical protein SGJ19_16885 [Planctomycetia bacterium]|nr:hypothetical protein [Planctomycetia bacterium]
MASITHDKKTGRRRIQFVGADGKRKSLRLGKVNQRDAEAIKTRVEQLPVQKWAHLVHQWCKKRRSNRWQ